MSLRAVKADALYVVRSWLRHPASIAFSLILPLFLLVSFGFLFSPDEPEVPALIVEDLDGSDASARLVDLLRSGGSLQVVTGPGPGEAAVAGWLDAQEASGHLRIPSGYGASISGNGTHANLSLTVKAASAHEAGIVRAAVESAASGLRGGSPVVVASEKVEEPIPYSSFLLPGIIGMNALTTGTFMAFTAILQLRNQGLLERLAVSPVRKPAWLLGRMIGITVVSLAITTFLVGVAYLVFRTPLHLSLWAPVLVVGGTLVFAGLGTVLAVTVREVENAGAIANLALFPILLVSGSFFDISSLPSWLQWLPKVSPLTYLNDGLRESLILGNSATPALYSAILVGMAAIVVFLGGSLMRWTKKD